MIIQLDLLVPDAYVTAFKDMFQNAPTSNFEKVKRTIESETGKKIEDLFSSKVS